MTDNVYQIKQNMRTSLDFWFSTTISAKCIALIDIVLFDSRRNFD